MFGSLKSSWKLECVVLGISVKAKVYMGSWETKPMMQKLKLDDKIVEAEENVLEGNAEAWVGAAAAVRTVT